MSMNFHRIAAAATVACAVLLAGCAGTPANFAPKGVTDVAQIDTTKGRKISSEASGFQLLLLIPIKVNSRHVDAYQGLVDQAGDGVLADITVTESWKYAFVGTIYTTTMEATVYPKVAATAK
jgi:hypothetical protein